MARRFWVFSVLILGFARISSGEEAKQDTTPVYSVKEVVVTATRMERAVKDLSATVSVVDRDEIEASNANSCTDILSTLPGLFVQKTGAFGRADVSIRGIGQRGRRMMVLVDGRPVKMGLFGCTITHSLPLNNAERIEVVRGPLSVLYGSDALGGVINIITRKPVKPLETNYTFSYSAFNTYAHQVQAGGVQGPLSLFVTADKRNGNGHLPNSAYDGSDFTTRIGYKIGLNTEATVSGKYFDGYKEEPLKATDPDTLTSDAWNDYRRGAVDVTLTGEMAKFDWLLKGYRNFGEHAFSDGWLSEDFTNGALVNVSRDLLPSNELLVGGEFRQQSGKRLSTTPGEWSKDEYAIFFHDEQTLFDRLILTFGARQNWDEISGQEMCPQAGLVIHPIEGTTVRGLVNKGFRSPQINELYLFPPSNEKIKAERVWNYEIGITQRILNGVNVDVVGYQMVGDNLIQIAKNSSSPPPYIFKNTGGFEFRGVEAGINARSGNKLHGRVYYSYLDPGEKTTGRPGGKVDLSLRYTENRFAISLSNQYVTNYFAEDSSKSPIDDYFVTNAKLSCNLIRGSKVFLAVDNVLDTDYEIYADLSGGAAGLYTMPGRTWTTGLSFEF
jgi:iron complex outermembrane receptor protein